MKRNNILYRIAALLLFVTLTAACTNEDDYAAPGTDGTTPATPLTITVTDGAYASAETPEGGNTPGTRAVERGYGTEFTKGDRIGLYVVEKDAAKPGADRTFLHENLCLTHDGKGWTLPDGKELTHQPPTGGEVLYFAYYPYQDNMEGKVFIEALDEYGNVTTEARWFFGPLIDDWTPAADQRTYEAYTASDLMTAKGKVTTRTDDTDGSVLSFEMEHQMALTIIRVPSTQYYYTETIGSTPIKKSYRLYSGMEVGGNELWMENDHTARYLQKPGISMLTFNGVYYNSELKDFTVRIDSQSPGMYYLYTIDGGEETETERVLQVGDFYMSDGTIIPNEHVTTKMPAAIQRECIGVVYFVGEKKALAPITNHRRNDHLLKRDYPNCTHGLVLALQNASDQCAWSNNTNELVNNWTNAPERGEEKVDISATNSFKGYSSTKALLAYNAAYPGKKVLVAEAARQYKVASPEGSSGWFMMDISDASVIKFTALDAIQNALGKAGGTKLDDSFYWTTHEGIAKNDAHCFDILNEEKLGLYVKKNEQYTVRPVLAF